MRGFNHHEDWLVAVHGPSSGGGTSTQTSTTNSISQPWSGQTAFLSGSGGDPGGFRMTAPGQWQVTPATPPTVGLFPEAERLYSNQAGWPQYFPSSTYAPLTAGQGDVINQITALANAGGTPALRAAGGALGGILGPNGTAATSGAFNTGQDYLTRMLTGQGGTGSATLDQAMSLLPGAASMYGAGGNTLGGVASMLPEFSGAYGAGAGGLGAVSSMLPQFASTYGQGAGSLRTLADPSVTAGALPGLAASQGALSQYLDPNFLNPYTSPGFQSVVNDTLANVIPQTSASFIRGGRTDSGLADRTQTMAATDAVGRLASAQYNANITAQQNAANQLAQRYGMLGGLQTGAAGQLLQGGLGGVGTVGQTAGALQGGGLTGTGLVGTAGGNLGQLGLGGVGQATGAAGTAGALQQGAEQIAANNLLQQQQNQVRAAAVAPVIDQATMGDLTTALQSQGLNQQDAQNVINAAIQRWNFSQTQPWNMLQQYQGVVGGTGFGSQGQTTGSISTPSNSNPILGGLAGGLGGAAAGGMLGSALGGTVMGMGAGPVGAVAGGTLGLLASLLGNR